MRVLRPKILLIYSLVLIISSAFSSTKPALDPDVAEVDIDNNPKCSMTFEGFICWDDNDNCPKYVLASDVGTHKKCEKRVRHFRLHEDEEAFPSCNPNKDDATFRKIINTVKLVGRTISAVSLLFSIIIFVSLESWQKTRISVHVNFFVAYLLNNCCSIIIYYVTSDVPTIWCRTLNVIRNYFMLSSYTWMLCESLHLHRALSVIFAPQNTPFRMFAVLGWGVPVVITGLYAASRTFLERTGRCWIDRGNSSWIITVSILICLVTSFVYLLKVTHTLINKLHRAQNVNSSTATRKTAKAALLLMSIFGIHFALVQIRPNPSTTAQKMFEFFLALLTSLQGVCISVLLCFANHEVIAIFRNGINRVREVFNVAAVVEEDQNPDEGVVRLEMM